ncbi:hypothetical protein [Hoeflea sp.]|uniref:hypothetical protein n=1 Tax=Hoeflea sp. TaxID=1940281 RepID=UPI0019CE691B|nr:hypothetical protein [Hoeflea sp.]MBC7282115.1 hypothetical protein [Hoeflea sp.]
MFTRGNLWQKDDALTLSLPRAALEREAKALGVYHGQPGKQRMTVEQMIALGKKVTALPLLDPRSPEEIIDDLNER